MPEHRRILRPPDQSVDPTGTHAKQAKWHRRHRLQGRDLRLRRIQRNHPDEHWREILPELEPVENHSGNV